MIKPKTKVFRLEDLHREMWRWLAETGATDKHMWPGWSEYEFVGQVPLKCFACEAAGVGMSSPSVTNCAGCPIVWPCDEGTVWRGKISCPCEKLTHEGVVEFYVGLYGKWLTTDGYHDEDERKRLAKEIAELPWDNSFAKHATIRAVRQVQRLNEEESQ